MTRFSRIARLTSKILITGILGLALVVGIAYLLFPKEVLSQAAEYCADNPEWCTKLFRVDDLDNGDATTKRIHGTRYRITNTSGTDYFVPHQTAAEWHRFACAAGKGGVVFPGIDCKTSYGFRSSSGRRHSMKIGCGCCRNISQRRLI